MTIWQMENTEPTKPYKSNDLYNKIACLLEEARRKVASAVNIAMVYTYFEIGRIIVEDEQNGNSRAEYGKEVLKSLSERLTRKFGKGFSVTNLKQMRDFYQSYSIRQTLSDQFYLSWSHYLFLMRIDNKAERDFYEKEAENSNWSLRELKQTVLPDKQSLAKLILDR